MPAIASDNNSSPPPPLAGGGRGEGRCAPTPRATTSPSLASPHQPGAPASRAMASASAANPGSGTCRRSARGQRLGRARSVAQPPSRGRQPQPRLPHIARGTDLFEQCRRAHVVMTEAGGRQRQRQRLVARRQAAGTVQPAPPLRRVPGGNLRLPALERLERERRGTQPAPSVGDRLRGWTAADSACRQGGKIVAGLLQPLRQRPAPARPGRGRDRARRRGRARDSGPASSGHRHARAPPRRGTSAARSARSVGTSWPPPCIAPMANIAPTWPRPAAFSNNASAPGWSFGPPRPVSIISASCTSASTMPTSAARLIQARPSSGLASTPRPFDQHAAVPDTARSPRHRRHGAAIPRPCGRRARRRRLRPGRRRN